VIDLDTFLAAGGTDEEAKGERLKLDQAEKSITTGVILNPVSPPIVPALPKAPATYVIKDAKFKGQGAFAARELHRGDLILAEKPLFRLSEGSSHAEVKAAVQKLSPSQVNSFLSLQNSHPECPHFTGIYRTNTFWDGLCLDASSFNHSCVPNARYSWHEKSGRQRIFALCDIAKDEEICVSYLAGRNCYATARAERRERLSQVNRFECGCVLCAKDIEWTEASDDRRRQIFALWEGLTRQSDPARILRDVVHAIRLMREDGYYADADDFATDAAALCAGYSDWESSKYWANFMFESKKAEFGEDHEHTKRAKEIWQNPKDLRWHKQAGMFKPQSFQNIRL
jgi:hypothetical protein